MTHTLGRNPDGTWWIGRADVGNDGAAPITEITMMFNKVSFVSALRLVNCLNGGDDVTRLDPTSLKSLEMCWHG